jgi:hypothetical protein
MEKAGFMVIWEFVVSEEMIMRFRRCLRRERRMGAFFKKGPDYSGTQLLLAEAKENRYITISGIQRDFTFGAARHQVADCFFGRFAFTKNRMHLFRDGHFNLVSAGQTHRGVSRENTFRDGAMHIGKNFRKLAIAAQFHTYASIA